MKTVEQCIEVLQRKLELSKHLGMSTTMLNLDTVGDVIAHLLVVDAMMREKNAKTSTPPLTPIPCCNGCKAPLSEGEYKVVSPDGLVTFCIDCAKEEGLVPPDYDPTRNYD